MKTPVDEHGQVHNSEEAYQALGLALSRPIVEPDCPPQIFRWADDRMSAFNLLLYLADDFQMPFNRRLYVGVEGKGFYGFPIDGALHWGYLSEKLNLAGGSAQPLAELLNGILQHVQEEL